MTISDGYRIFVGIDWGADAHQVWVTNHAGERIGERVVPHTGANLVKLADWLVSEAGGAGRGRPIPARRSVSRTRVFRTEDGMGQPGGRTRRRERQLNCVSYTGANDQVVGMRKRRQGLSAVILMRLNSSRVLGSACFPAGILFCLRI